MEVSIPIKDSGVTATQADVIDNHVNVPEMMMTIYVGLFTEAGDRVKVIIVEHKLAAFPIPSTDEQLAIALPAIEAFKQENAPVIE